LYNYGDIDALIRHIRFLLENPKETKKIGVKGFEIASKEYRWKSVVDRIEKLYRDAIEQFRKRGKIGP
jgi:glycosyltransferase involved in cell wall biosynthesis